MSKILIPIILGISLHAQVYQRNIGTGFRSTGAPGSILASRYGDIYIDTSASNVYVCTDPASYCSGVTAGEWVLTSGSGGGGGAGTVTSVALSLPGIFSVSGSPVTGSGTLTGTLVSQSANLLFAAPSGSSGTPSFRALTALDLPVTVVQTNTANTYSGGALQDLSAMKLKLPTTTVSTLPSAASNTGVSYIVTDGGSPSDCTVGSGSTRVNCISNGTTWVSLGGVGTALGDPGSNGLVVRTSAYITTARTLSAGSAKISITNGDGTTGNPTVDLGSVASTNLSDTSVIARTNQANTFSAGSKQTFSASATTAGLNIASVTADPSSPANGDMWYRSDTGKFRCYQAGVTTDCIGAGGGSSSVTGLYSGTLNFPAIADGATAELTFTATGATTGMALAVAAPSALETGVIPTAFVSSANTVKVRLYNGSGATVDPVSATYYVRNLDSLGYYSGTATIDPAAIADGACANIGTITVTGVATGDNVAPGWPSTLDAGVVGTMFVTSANTVTARVCNWSGATVDIASTSFKAGVTK